MTRPNKHAPAEVSSKQPVSVLRDTVPVAKKKAIDPRFDRAFGHFNEDLFSKSYRFLGDLQREEQHKLRDSLQTEQNPSRRQHIKKTLERINSMKKSKERREQRQRILRDHRKLEAQLVEQHGKTAYYLKRGQVRALELAEEYEKVKKRVGDAAELDKFIEKKRKRKASRQKRFMPTQ